MATADSYNLRIFTDQHPDHELILLKKKVGFLTWKLLWKKKIKFGHSIYILQVSYIHMIMIKLEFVPSAKLSQ